MQLGRSSTLRADGKGDEGLPGTRWPQEVKKAVSNRYVGLGQLETSVRAFLQKINERHKPSHKLYEAIMPVTSKHDGLSDTMANMTLESTDPNKKPDRDQRITLGGRLYHLKVRQVTPPNHRQ